MDLATVNNAVWITICLIVTVVINMFGAGVYGECEFIFAYVLALLFLSTPQFFNLPLFDRSIKVITITGLIILGIVLDLGVGPNHDLLDFLYWKDPGPFVQFNDIAGAKGQFLGWWSVMTQAAFSFIGTEIVAVRT